MSRQRDKHGIVTVVIIDKTEAELLILGAQIILNVLIVMCIISELI